MKIKIKLTILAVCIASLSINSTVTMFDNNFEKDFVEKIETLKNNIQSVSNNFHQIIEKNVSEATKNMTSAPVNINNALQQSPVHFSQQSSSSLSFENIEKSIKITEQKNQNIRTFTIIITDKIPSRQNIQISDDQIDNNINELQALNKYMHHKFHSKQAQIILDECIDVMMHQPENRSISIESSQQDSKKMYTITLTKIQIDTIEESIPENNIKNKKRHRK